MSGPGSSAAKREEVLFRPAASTLRAGSLAIVGASERARWPGEIYRNLRAGGYPGRIALVNPRQAQVFGERCCIVHKIALPFVERACTRVQKRCMPYMRAVRSRM